MRIPHFSNLVLIVSAKQPVNSQSKVFSLTSLGMEWVLSLHRQTFFDFSRG